MGWRLVSQRVARSETEYVFVPEAASAAARRSAHSGSLREPGERVSGSQVASGDETRPGIVT